MRQLADPQRLARRQLAALVREVPLAGEGVPEGVHQTRVASRRLREMLPLFAIGSDRDAVARKLRARVRRLTRGLGRVRELDVAGVTLDDLVAHQPSYADAVAAVRAALAEERPAAVRDMHETLASIDLAKLVRRISDLAGSVTTPAMRRRVALRLSRRLDQRAQALRAAVEDAGLIYAPERLHRVRIAMKKFRYALELARDLGRVRLKGSIVRLKRLQDLLGTLHDLEVLAVRVRDCAADAPDPGLRLALAGLARDLDERVRSLHGDFIVARESLTVVFYWARRARLRLDLPPVRLQPRPATDAGSRSSGPIEAAG